MPLYEYHCPSNGRTVEVMHPMSHTVTTWGELCTLNEADLGETPADTPVERGLTTSQIKASKDSVSLPFSGGGSCGCGHPAGGCQH
ncbi:zinc ribbon domain-containing protein [Mucisphaera sp.]|uniref:zinc ribbon domain-containing protein n=1 Tax=Mucisphaera sp. TaxID=2913024 RepID=UPI003D142732